MLVTAISIMMHEEVNNTLLHRQSLASNVHSLNGYLSFVCLIRYEINCFKNIICSCVFEIEFNSSVLMYY